MITIAGIQMGCRANMEDNFSKAEQMIEAAAKQGAGLVCLPEIFYLDYSGPFKPELAKLAETLPDGPVCERLSAWAKRYRIAIVAGVLERDVTRIFNSCVAFDEKGLYQGKYRKTYIPLAGKSFEKYYFSPGNTEPAVFTLAGMQVGILICYDRHFPELARLLALKGAELLLVPTGAPDVKGRSNTWRSVLVSRAIENNVFVMGVNRYGEEANRRCFGQSLLVDPWGVIQAEAADGETVLGGGIDLQEIANARMEFGHLRDIRQDIVQELNRHLA